MTQDTSGHAVAPVVVVIESPALSEALAEGSSAGLPVRTSTQPNSATWE